MPEIGTSGLMSEAGNGVLPHGPSHRACPRLYCLLDEIVSGTASIEGIAARQKCSVRQVNMTISMAFIAPALVKAAVEGRLPRGIGIATFRDAPAEWSLQFERLGLAQP